MGAAFLVLLLHEPASFYRVFKSGVRRSCSRRPRRWSLQISATVCWTLRWLRLQPTVWRKAVSANVHTVFLRVLEADDKATALRRLIDQPSALRDTQYF